MVSVDASFTTSPRSPRQRSATQTKASVLSFAAAVLAGSCVKDQDLVGGDHRRAIQEVPPTRQCANHALTRAS
jgi:hypothetical protein